MHSQASWIGSLLPLGALVGGIAGGSLVEILGRKTTILATSVPFIFCKSKVSILMRMTFDVVKKSNSSN